MDDLIRNVNDPHFSGLLKKLMDVKWLDKIIDTPATERHKRNIEFIWSMKGQMCLLTIKNQIANSAYWSETKTFLTSLNEQEEAFFHENILSVVPRHTSI